MAFSPESFKKAMGGPMGGAPAPMGAPKAPAGGLDLEGLMGPPGGMEDGPGDIEGPEGEGGESPLKQALEGAGYQVDEDKLGQIKAILGDTGGMSPMGGEDELGETPSPSLGSPGRSMGATSKIGKLLGGK